MGRRSPIPKRIKILPARWIEPELRRCVEKAGNAVGKKSVLTDGEIMLLGNIGFDPSNTLIRKLPLDENDMPIGDPASEYVLRDEADQLARIMERDPVAAARAIIAAHKEAVRIKMTKLWCVRQAVRRMACFGRIPGNKPIEFDVQEIAKRVKKSSGFVVSAKLIHKAIRQERDFHNALKLPFPC
jgi:hypothetical protein